MILLPVREETDIGIQFPKAWNGSEIIDIEQLCSFENKDRLRIVSNFVLIKGNIIAYLIRNKRYHQQRHQWDYKNSWIAREKYIKIYNTPTDYVCIADYHSKFSQDFISFDIAHRLEQLDTEKQFTCASDAKHRYYKELSANVHMCSGRKYFTERYPQPTQEEVLYWNGAKNHVNGLYFFNVNEYENVYNYDLKSSYPARLYENLLPVGNGTILSGDEEPPARYWCLWRVFIKSATPLWLDVLELGANPYGEYYLTQELYGILTEFYAGEWEKKDGLAYKTRKDKAINRFFEKTLFSEFSKVEPFYRKYAKGMANSFIGTFGTNYNTLEYRYYIRNRAIYRKPYVMHSTLHAYFPVYLYVVGAAKSDFIRLCYRNRSAIIYGNTDGVLSLEPLEECLHNEISERIGAFDERILYRKLCIKYLNNYCGITEDGEVITKLSGRIKPNNLTYDQFKNGFNSLVMNRDPQTGLIQYGEHEEEPFTPGVPIEPPAHENDYYI